MEERSTTASGSGATLVACDAFGPDGALSAATVELNVAGRQLTADGAGTSAPLGHVLGAGDTLLVFLRHLG